MFKIQISCSKAFPDREHLKLQDIIGRIEKDKESQIEIILKE